LLVEVNTPTALDFYDGSNLLVLIKCEDQNSVGPSLDSVLSVLAENGISAKSQSMLHQSSADLVAFISSQQEPVFVLHHYESDAFRGLLALQGNGSDTGNDASTQPVPLTEAEISQYQVSIILIHQCLVSI
jgi:hypothetical protein